MSEQTARRAPAGPVYGRARRKVMRLHGLRLIAGRVIWGGLAVLALAVYLYSLPADYALLSQPRAESAVWTYLSTAQAQTLAAWGLSARFYGTYILALELVTVGVFAGVGLLLYTRRSDEATALFVAATCVVFGSTSVASTMALLEARPDLGLLVDLLNGLGLAGVVLLFYLFPDRRFVPRWTVAPGVLWTAWMLVWPFVPALSPRNVPALWGWAVNFVPLALGMFAQVHRYRHYSDAAERQQTKWVVGGFGAALLGFFVFNMGIVLYPPLQEHGTERLLYMFLAYPLVSLLPLLLAPISLAFAALRLRLWDIDVIFRRTLGYGVVTALLALFYYGSVVALQWLFRLVTGEQSAVAIALSTLAMALAFSPLRGRVQRWLDRRFYRRRYDSAQTLEAFGSAVRKETDLEQLTVRLFSAVEETVQPNYLSLWLRGPRPAREPADRKGG